MSDAPVPGDNEQPVVREQVAKHIGVREDRSEHERPSHNAAPVHLGSWQVSRPVLFSYARGASRRTKQRSEEHTSELQSRGHLVCRLLLEKKKKKLALRVKFMNAPHFVELLIRPQHLLDYFLMPALFGLLAY